MNISGLWVNQNGSTVSIEVNASGRVTGWYRSRKGRSAVGKQYPIAGQQNGDILTFLVDWRDPEQNLHAITSFSGRCVVDLDGETTIHTLWVLARQFEDEQQLKPTGAWNAFLTNADVFVRKQAD